MGEPHWKMDYFDVHNMKGVSSNHRELWGRAWVVILGEALRCGLGKEIEGIGRDSNGQETKTKGLLIDDNYYLQRLWSLMLRRDEKMRRRLKFDSFRRYLQKRCHVFTFESSQYTDEDTDKPCKVILSAKTSAKQKEETWVPIVEWPFKRMYTVPKPLIQYSGSNIKRCEKCCTCDANYASRSTPTNTYPTSYIPKATNVLATDDHMS